MKWVAPLAFDGSKFLQRVVVRAEGDSLTEVSLLSTEEEYLTAQEDADYVLSEQQCLLPGFINLHTHLELTHLAGVLPRKTPFPDWVRQLQQQTRTWTPPQWDASVQQGVLESVQGGTTSVLDVGNSGANLKAVSGGGLRLWACFELLGLASHQVQSRFQKALELVQQGPDAWIPENRCGLSAHALYSTHPDLFALAAQWCAHQHFPLTFHLAESLPEAELYWHSEGLFRTWLDQMQESHPFQQPRGSALYLAQEMGMIPKSIVIHGNMLSVQELGRLPGLEASLVHCPQSARWFGHPELNIQACLDQGVNLCLGTDSLASAESLSLWQQMAVLWERVPDLSLTTLLHLVTRHPARALEKEHVLGCLQPGAWADVQVVHWPLEKWNTQGSEPPEVQAVWIGNQKVYEKQTNN